MKTTTPSVPCTRPGLFGRCLLCIPLVLVLAASLGHDESSATSSAKAPPPSALDLPKLVPAALANDAGALAALRAAGQPGLDALLAANPDLLAKMRSGAIPLDDPKAANMRLAIEKVARQRDAHASGLYWYTDLEAAKAAAAESGRHILSLRMLGNLDEEYSCANSRFFRTVLYANREVSLVLREHFILHWKSVRPAPLVTIDMGDGRRIKRTITGNSIHYVLDAEGGVIDALPGLYGPAAFLDALARSETLVKSDVAAARSWHGREADRLCRQWLDDAVRAGMYGVEPSTTSSANRAGLVAQLLPTAFPKRHVPFRTGLAVQGSDAPTQATPAPRKYTEFDPPAVAKSMVERPISRRTTSVQTNLPAAIPLPASAESSKKPLPDRMNNEWWQRIAALPPNAVRLDESSSRLMMVKLPRDSVREDERQKGGVIDGQTPFARTLRRFESAIAQDTVHNEYLFHAQIHQWLEEDPVGYLARDVDALNQRVYAELFLTPDHDAWLGMVPDDTYTALEKDGCACDVGAPSMRGAVTTAR